MKLALLLLAICVQSSVAALRFAPGASANLQIADALDKTPVSVSGGGSTISFAAWVKLESTNSGFLVAKNFGAGNNYALQFNRNSGTTNALTFLYQSGGNDEIFTSAPNFVPGTNVWFHVGFTYDYSGTGQFYLNGVPFAGAFTTGAGGLPDAVGGFYYMGTDNGSSHFMFGQVSEYTQFYRVILNASQMATLAKSRVKGIGRQIALANAGWYWAMDEVPNFTGISGTNRVIDSVLKNHTITTYNRVSVPGSPVGTVTGMAEQVCSYPPNE